MITPLLLVSTSLSQKNKKMTKIEAILPVLTIKKKTFLLATARKPQKQQTSYSFDNLFVGDCS